MCDECEDEGPEIWHAEDVAEYLRMHVDELAEARKADHFLRPARVGAQERWLPRDVQAFFRLLAVHGEAKKIPKEELEKYGLTIERPLGDAKKAE